MLSRQSDTTSLNSSRDCDREGTLQQILLALQASPWRARQGPRGAVASAVGRDKPLWVTV